METILETVPTIVASSHGIASSVALASHENILGLDVAFCNTVPVALFSPKTLSELRNVDFQKDLTNFVKSNLHIDFVYKFNLPLCNTERDDFFQGHRILSSLPADTGKGILIAGSSALHYLMVYFKGENTLNWKSNDVDIFYLNCESNNRMQIPGGNVDFVFCKDTSIENVLLNFDLPCCRVGFDFKYNFYVSAQALVAIFTGKMYMPTYFSTSHDFLKELSQYSVVTGKESFAENIKHMIIRRFYERVKKYQSRGFKTIYTHLDYLLPWVKNRFTYVNFTSGGGDSE
jgi:hypothetical protein